MMNVLDPRVKYEWWIYLDRVEVDLQNTIKSARKPNGIYLHPVTFETVRYLYGTIADMHLLCTEYNDDEMD